MKLDFTPREARAVLEARRAMLEAFEAEMSRRSPPDHATKLRVAEALWREAVSLGALPPCGRPGRIPGPTWPHRGRARSYGRLA